MKNSLLLLSLLVLISTPAASQYGYIGLYADASHYYTAYCPAEGLHSLEMWIWCLPGPNGQICAEFSVDYPAYLIQSTVTENDDLISVQMGYLSTGISVCYVACQYDWHWIFHQTLWVTDPNAGHIEIAPHPEIGDYHAATCLLDYPIEPLVRLCDLYYNDPCPPGP